MKPSQFLVITGLSGSGKGTFLRALEDRGFYCVDNLPVGLISKFFELILKSEGEYTKAAVVMDVREGGGNLTDLPAILAEIRTHPGVESGLWFLEASDAALVRRFSETRRPHPLDPNQPVLASILHERELLKPIRAVADHVMDTSQFTIHELRKHVSQIFEGQHTGDLLVSLVSFGFKFGVPIDSDLVFDVRFLPNPHFVPELKPLTGVDDAVIDFMNSQEATGAFLKRLHDLVDFLLPQYEKEGKSYVTISIGCTGGRHRSVMISNVVADHLKDLKYRVKVSHRDVEKV